jgi:hypothetical protein
MNIPQRRVRLGFVCWHCESRAVIRNQRWMSKTSMELSYACSNADCGHTFVCVIEAVRTLSPSAYPAPPGVVVPISSHVQRRTLLALAEMPTASAGRVGNQPEPAHALQTDLFSALAVKRTALGAVPSGIHISKLPPAHSQRNRPNRS